MHGGGVIEGGVFKDPPRPGVFRGIVLEWTDNEPPGGTAPGGQFDLGRMRRRDKTEVYVDRLARFIRRATDGVRSPFFIVARSGVQSPASIKIRFTVFGLTRGSQWLALASSSAIRRLPHLGFCRRRSITRCSMSGAVRVGSLAAWLWQCSRAE